MSTLRVKHGNCSVVGCINQPHCLYSVRATGDQKRQWLHFIFNDNVPAAVCVSLYVCANHFTSDCFSNAGQYKAGFASTWTIVKGSVPPILDPETAPEPQVSVAMFWWSHLYTGQLVSSALVRYAMVFEASLKLTRTASSYERGPTEVDRKDDGLGTKVKAQANVWAMLFAVMGSALEVLKAECVLIWICCNKPRPHWPVMTTFKI